VIVDRLDRMMGGWLVGDFEPSLYRTQSVEVAVKRYASGAYEGLHHHKIATELTVIVLGEARMGGREVGPGDIVVLAPGEASDFTALTDVTLVAIKLPAVKDDKYPHDG